MADAHRQMLDLIVAAVTGLASTSSRVYEDQADAIAGTTFPVLAVEAQDVEAEVLGESHDSDEWLERHRLGVTVMSIAQTVASRDLSSLEVKHALLIESQLGIRRRYVGSRFLRSGEGDREFVAISNRFEIDYLVDNTVPDVIRER